MSNATELDKERKYLRPVSGYDSDLVHLSLYKWLPMFDAWVTGMSLCGESMRQGPLPEGTTVTCTPCEKWRPKYERMLAPGYRPEDDDPEVLRKRAETAERQVKQAQALVAKWQQVAAEREGATMRVDVAAGILKATLDGFNDLLSEVREQKDRPTHPDGTPYRYAEMVAEGWGFCDGCRMWSTATVERPHQCAGNPPFAGLRRVSDEALNGVLDELERGDR